MPASNDAHATDSVRELGGDGFQVGDFVELSTLIVAPTVTASAGGSGLYGPLKTIFSPARRGCGPCRTPSRRRLRRRAFVVHQAQIACK